MLSSSVLSDFATPWTVAGQAPLSMGILQERTLEWVAMPSSSGFMAIRWRNSGNSGRFYFGGAPESLQMVIAAMKLKDAYSLEGKL